MRLKDLATSVSDTFHLSREHVAIKDGFNVRFDKGTPDEWRQFVQSILANGIIKAISGCKDATDKFIVTDGHRRIAGLDEALAILEEQLKQAKADRAKIRAEEIKERIAAISIIPCESEPKGTTDVDRIFSMAISNTGKPLNLLENALAYERLMCEHQVSDTEIQRRTGITRTAFDNAMILINAPELHEFIRAGKVTPSLALEVCRKVKDKDQRLAIIKQGIANAKAAGKDHATAKHLSADVRQEVAPSKRGQKASIKGSATGSSGGSAPAPASNGRNSGTAGNGSRDADSSSTARTSPVRTLESVLTSRSTKLLSSIFEPKWNIDGTITFALNRENQSWFYCVEATQRTKGKDVILSLPWTYGVFHDGAACPAADADTRGFDEKDEAQHQALRALRHWLSRNPIRHTEAALKALDAVVAKLNGHNESSNGDDSSATGRGFTMHVNTGKSGAAGNGSRNSSPAHEAPTPPSEDETRISADQGDQTPADSDAAFDGFLRVLGDVKGIGGVTKKNERFACLQFFCEYLEGQHTHNQLKAFVLYGSKETRDLKVSER